VQLIKDHLTAFS